jgi:hypothetical protein
VKKYLIFIILFSGLLAGCCQDDKNYFIPDRKKLKFNENDLIIYRSTLANVDTFKVISVNIQSITLSQEEKLNCLYSEYYELLEIKLKKNNTSSENDGYFHQINYPDYNYSIKNWLGVDASSRLLRTFVGDYIIGETTYTNITRFDNASTGNILKLYYNEENGVVSYELTTGEIYNLSVYISSK